jgi:hypothetical protein
MKRTIILIAMLISVCLSFALLTDYYSFQATLGTYTPITGTAVPTALFDDVITQAIPMGMTFPYGTYSFNSVKICSNGWVGLGAALTSYDYDNDLASTAICPVVAPLWDDLSLEGGSVQYLLSGTTPNRKFVIQYGNAKWNYGATNQFNFQVVLYESGKIELIYGPHTGEPNTATATIGINMSPGGVGNFLSVTPGTPSTAASNISFNDITVFPSSGEIYRFEPVQSYTNDLATLYVTGSNMPEINNSSSYSVTVRNVGSAAQTDYQVKLYRGADTLIGSVNGTSISAGAIVSHQFSWTPTALGAETLYGKVVLTGDQNSANDQSPIFAVTVVPQGYHSVTIGNGANNFRVPMDFYWKNSIWEGMFYPSELNFSGNITGIEFYNNFYSSDLTNKPTNIWLGTTTAADLSGGMIPASLLTQAFAGFVNYPAGQNTIHIDMDTPFLYTGGNLVVMVQRPMDVDFFASTDYFFSQVVGTSRSRKAFSDATTLDPNNPPANAVLSGEFPKTTIWYVTGSATDDPSVPNLVSEISSVSPNPFSTSVSIDYTLKDSGAVSLSVYNLRGQLVRNLVLENKAAGAHSAVWDGKDSLGRGVAPGIYFCKMQANGTTDQRRLVLIK